MSAEIATFEEQAARLDIGLRLLEIEAAPSGLRNPSNGEVLLALSELVMTPMQHAHATMTHVPLDRPVYNPDTPKLGFDQPAELACLETRLGTANPFVLSSWVLKQNLLDIARDAGWTTPDGGLLYQSKTGVKAMDAGLMTGLSAMAAMQYNVALLTEDPNEFADVVERSLPTQVIPFTKMPNANNKKLEHLYNIRRTGSYDADSAAFELGLPNAEGFGFNLDRAERRVHPANWDKVSRFANGSNGCPAPRVHFFSRAWHQLKTAALNLPETRAVIDAPAEAEA